MPDGQNLDNKSKISSIKKARIAASLYFNGAGDRNRTYDLRVTSALLYRLSYTGKMLLKSRSAPAAKRLKLSSKPS